LNNGRYATTIRAPQTRKEIFMRVTVLGLGSMGTTLARLFAANGRTVTVWNRTADKADSLRAAGVQVAATAAEAIAASPVTVLCVYDYRAADAILAQAGVAAAATGKVLVQLSTGSPEDALAAAAWAARHGARFLDGAIQAAPSQMGQPETPILLSGDRATFRDVEPLLRDLAGNLVFLGDEIDAAATMDLATLSYVYGAFTGFVHGARMAEAKGLDVAQYGRIVNAISPTFGAFFEHEGRVIHSGDFRVSESPLRISVEATARILQASRAAGLDTQVPELAAGLLARADQAGLGGEELAALVKVLRGADGRSIRPGS
jgi:3-hydroxyisobutyrate dehydrogenase-like beta-hydroxyacid dehydrogenase